MREFSRAQALWKLATRSGEFRYFLQAREFAGVAQLRQDKLDHVLPQATARKNRVARCLRARAIGHSPHRPKFPILKCPATPSMKHDSSGGPGRCGSINTAGAVRLWVGGRHLHGQIRQPVLTVRPFRLHLLCAGRLLCPQEAAVRVGAAQNEKGAKGVSGRCVVRGW